MSNLPLTPIVHHLREQVGPMTELPGCERARSRVRGSSLAEGLNANLAHPARIEE
jgi:hypothetical protein